MKEVIRAEVNTMETINTQKKSVKLNLVILKNKGNTQTFQIDSEEKKKETSNKTK